MSFKRIIPALAVAVSAYVGVASAQVNATLTMKSGERLSAQLVDLNASGFVVRVNGEERNIAPSDVAVIDFAAGPMGTADWAKFNEGQHVVWLRNGQQLRAELVDIGGINPLRITVRSGNEERDLSSHEVSRIVMQRPANMATTGTTGQTTGTGTGSTIVLNAQQQWTPTGITVRKGEVLRFDASGEIRLSNNPNDVASIAGAKSGRYPAANAPMARTLAGALIGRIDNGQPFGIGNQASVTMPESGQLSLGINDDSLTDNDGEFRVEITRTQQRRRR